MKLFVFSDSHGHPEGMLRTIEQGAPDMIIHLGDGSSDVRKIKEQFPQIPLKAVQGNCDLGSDLPETELFLVGTIKIFITHGHIYSVKRTLSLLLGEAKAQGADIVMYGHTHRPDCSVSALYVLNPGSCSDSSPSYGEVVLDGNGKIFSRILTI